MRKQVTVLASTLIVVVLVCLVAIQALVIPAVWLRGTDSVTPLSILILVVSIVCVLALEAGLALILLVVRRRGRGEADPPRHPRIGTVIELCLFTAAALIATAMFIPVNERIQGSSLSFPLTFFPLILAAHGVAAVSCLVSTMVMASTAPGPLTPADSVLTGPATTPVPRRRRVLVVLSQILAIIMVPRLVLTQAIYLDDFSSPRSYEVATLGYGPEFHPTWSLHLLSGWSIVCILLLEAALIVMLSVDHRRSRTDADPAWVRRMTTIVRWDLLTAVLTAMAFSLVHLRNRTDIFTLTPLLGMIALPMLPVAATCCLAAAARTTSVALAPPRPAGEGTANWSDPFRGGVPQEGWGDGRERGGWSSADPFMSDPGTWDRRSW